MGVLLESMKNALSSNKAGTYILVFKTIATFEISLTQALLCKLKYG